MMIRQEAVMLDMDAHANAKLPQRVAAELDWDPKVDSRDITVAADGGAVALRGTVSSLRKIRDAEQAARRVHGVTSVSSHLTVRPVFSGRAQDGEILTAVLQALMLNSTIPATVTANVEDGVVYLAGAATWHWQRDEAERVSAAVAGVLRTTNEIKLTPVPADTDLQKAIMAALRRHALLTHDVSVDVPISGVVILSGTVTTWAEHDEAVNAGWSARGVARVYDRIAVIR
jgi:osmotically-inducible protein OsmY